MLNRMFQIAAFWMLISVMLGSARAGVNVGDEPAYRFETVDGHMLTPETYEGKLLVIDFWATWCGPCLAVADHMVAMHRQYGPKGLRMLGVSLDTNLSKLKQVAEREGFDWPQVCDAGGWDSAYAKQFGVGSIPRTLLISPEGEVLWIGHPARLEPHIQEALRTHPPRAGRGEQSANERREAIDTLRTIQSAVVQAEGLNEAMEILAAFAPEHLEDHRVARKARTLSRVMARVAERDDARGRSLAAALKAHEPAAAVLQALRQRLEASATDVGASGDEKADREQDRTDRLAAIRLRHARTYRKADKHEHAIRICLQIVHEYSQTPAADDAAKRLAAYRSDEQHADTLARLEAEALLDHARDHRAAGRVDRMRDCCEQLLAAYPDSEQAAAAKQLLDASESDESGVEKVGDDKREAS